MINNSKLKIIIPFAMSTICLALSGCGGESATIHEDPNAGFSVASNGCNWNSSQCQPFVVAYPVDGLNFDCSSDKNNHFATKFETNVSTGGCRIGDSVQFYINGVDTNKRIELGAVNLSELMPSKVSPHAVQISLMDIAKGMTGKSITSQNNTDNTYKVLLGLINILQDISTDEGTATTKTDIQLVKLDDFLKNSGSSSQAVKIKKDLDKLAANVTVADFIDGTYISDLAVWRSIDANESDAIVVATQLLNIKNAGTYVANFFAFPTPQGSLEGFNGKDTSNSDIKTVANLYAITDRNGYSLGYTIQWVGIPTDKGGFGRLQLLTQVSPNKLDTNLNESDLSVKDWIDPLTNKITNPLKFYSATTTSDSLDINKGQLFNQLTIPGNKFVYNNVTNTTHDPGDSVYGAWIQKNGTRNYSGSIDISKVSPLTYLDGRVFQDNAQYKFPLYLNLTFGFDHVDLKNDKIILGIVIDKNGNIKTNLANNAKLEKNNIAPSCPNNPVPQYRIGTLGTSNPDDNSITVRMILANKVFGALDGAIIGLNTDLQNTSGLTTQNMAYSSGVKINLPKSSNGNFTITDFTQGSTQASWLNMFASAQAIYNAGKNNTTLTSDQLNLAKLNSGKITAIEKLNCS